MNREHIIRLARDWIGTPYGHQASLKGIACDCLGLVRGVWREAYGAEPEAPPPYAASWAMADGRELLAEAGLRHFVVLHDAQAFGPGDLLLFRWRPHLPARHAGIATTRGHMVHAQEGAVVSEISLSPWWRRQLAYAFRFPEAV